MKCFSFENELETVRNRQKIARCARRFMRPSKVEMATSHTEVVQLLAARPECEVKKECGVGAEKLAELVVSTSRHRSARESIVASFAAYSYSSK